MNKEEYIHSLSNVKLVIGNGFDLHCFLHTSYKDFFDFNYKKYNLIHDAYSYYEETDDFKMEKQLFDSVSVWDIFFEFNSRRGYSPANRLWCDIEKLMLCSFVDEPSSDSSADEVANYITSSIHWNIIEKHIIKNSLAQNHADRFVVKFINRKMEQMGLYPKDFYLFLLDELKQFEVNFGEFIYKQQHETWFERCNPGQMFLNKPFLIMAVETIEELCNKDNLVSIDTFNYGDIYVDSLLSKMRHINGNVTSPIFGIDTIFAPTDKRFIFTKTARRMESDFYDVEYREEPQFENVIIYGHSLDKSDYSYFFPLFDKLNLLDPNAKGVVVFAYSVYDKKIESKIIKRASQSISKILYEYAVDKHVNNPSRLLDNLKSNRRFFVTEIPCLDRKLYGATLVDQDWEKLQKDIEMHQKVTSES